MNFFTRKHQPRDNYDERPRPRLPEVEPPPYPERGQRTSAYAPPPLRRDPEIESLTVSANLVLELRQKIHDLEVANSQLLAERETWRARATAKEELLVVMMHDLDRYKSFCIEFKARFHDVGVILLDVVRKADEAEVPKSSEELRAGGSQPLPIINESHLAGGTLPSPRNLENDHDEPKL